MYTFDAGLYLSGKLKSKKLKLVESFMQGRIPRGIYVIYRNDSSGKAEFTKSSYLKQEYYARHDMHILGFAEDYKSALRYLALWAEEAAEV